ncbi:LytR/AlgR family response regulator transcription factor [Niabella beijingensis]|uniref:LytR/AlgR family response regulator transcription factor n=1 Tax=Niabella beijingensis TaxID=2872700 RepID=UPI001CBBEB2F|nr:LytTR family DNA-binding domain-containing protein [Niabella beijingensis]MBZ4190846.1 LytTR family DNA-binding domain-containing protein [Niabella beijingensis]
MIRTIIVDDEPLIRELLLDNLNQIPFIEVVRTCKNALELSQYLQTDSIDLLFMDIQMPGISGIQFLSALEHPPMVIMVTAYEKYALQGFELNVVDYILKPFSFERILKACNRALELHQLKKTKSPGGEPPAQHLFVNVEYTLVKVTIAAITYIEGLKDYIKIHLDTDPKPVLTRMTIKSMEEKLPGGAFARTHKSYLVALDKITVIKRDLIYIGSTELPLSESYREAFLQAVKRLEGNRY